MRMMKNLSSALVACGLSMGAMADDCEPYWDADIGWWGASGYITTVTTMTDEDGTRVFAGGWTSHMGGLLVNHVAQWDGNAWSPMAGGVEGVYGMVWGLYPYDDGSGQTLYMTGDFEFASGTDARKVAQWLGTSWAPLGPGIQVPNDEASALKLLGHDHDSGHYLYIGGWFAQAGGQPANGITRWNVDTQSFSSMGGGTCCGYHAQVNDIIVFDDGTGEALYVCGWFSEIGGIPASRVARWDFETETWSAMGEGVPGAALTMAIFDDGSGDGEQLYIAGAFTEGGSSATENHIMRWNPAALTWESVGRVTGGVTGNGSVSDMAVFDDGSGPALYVGGAIGAIDDVPVSQLARWDGKQWSAVATVSNGMINALHPAHDEQGPVLYVGGFFTHIDNNASFGIGAYRGCETGPACSGPSDLNCSGSVDVFDLLILLAEWGPCPDPGAGAPCAADLDTSGIVDVFDLLTLLANWG